MSIRTPTYIELRKLITKHLKFKHKKTSGSHEIYEGVFNNRLRNVTLDKNHDKLSASIQKRNISSMWKQMGYINKKDFMNDLNQYF